MKKEIPFKFLTYLCCLLHGSFYSKKRWYMSPFTILSFIALLLTIFISVEEFVGYQHYVISEKMKAALSKLKNVHVHQIGFCLRPLGQNETLIEVKNENELVVNIIEVPKNQTDLILENLTKSRSNQPSKHPMSDLEDIVRIAYRLMIFTTNIIIRIFIWFVFSSLVDLLWTVFQPEDKVKKEGSSDSYQDIGHIGIMEMSHLWYESVQKWSVGEKVLLLCLILTQLLRQVEFMSRYYLTLASTGFDMLIIPCIIVHVLLEQFKVLFARELIPDIVALFLVTSMNTLTSVIFSIIHSEEQLFDMNVNKSKTKSGNCGIGFFTSELEGSWMNSSKGAKSKEAEDILFVKTRSAAVMNGGMEAIDEQISGIIANKTEFRERKRKTYLHGGNDSSITATEVVYAEIDFLISSYFDLMSIWDEFLGITGFLTLVLFCELTTAFCLNAYITLDFAVNVGLFSRFGANGILKGISFLINFVCVCNAAQELHDMTPILLERLIKLKLELLSQPVELYRKKDDGRLSSHSPNNPNLSQCERCRGLGSFLSETLSYIRAHPFELSAMGYFTVSRSTLTTITGVIVTYLVVLVQFQSYASTSSK